MIMIENCAFVCYNKYKRIGRVVLMKQINRRTIALVTLFLALTAVMSACGIKQTDSSTATPDAAQAKDSGNLHTLYFKDGDKSEKVAFNPCVSGWYKSKNGFIPYTQGKETAYVPHFEQVILDCNGYEKKIFFWTPDDYDPHSDEKYATIYVLDGQGEVNMSEPDRRPDGCEYIPDQVRSMTQTTGYKAIIVAVSTYGDLAEVMRDDELIPDIGDAGAVRSAALQRLYRRAAYIRNGRVARWSGYVLYHTGIS